MCDIFSNLQFERKKTIDKKKREKERSIEYDLLTDITYKCKGATYKSDQAFRYSNFIMYLRRNS